MEVTENVHGVNVTFWKTHVGHDNDLEHLVLTKTDKAKISGNLSRREMACLTRRVRLKILCLQNF